jgi:hypothetical protein
MLNIIIAKKSFKNNLNAKVVKFTEKRKPVDFQRAFSAHFGERLIS